MKRSRRNWKALRCLSCKVWEVGQVECPGVCLVECLEVCLGGCREVCLTWVVWVVLPQLLTQRVDPPLKRLTKYDDFTHLVSISELDFCVRVRELCFVGSRIRA